MSSEALERAKSACNICGEPWPNHIPACAYVGNVLDKEAALAEVARLEQERDRWQRESDDQMGQKLAAQLTLKAVCDALDLPMVSLGNGWTEATPKILARIETIVDEANRAFAERDQAREVLRRSPIKMESALAAAEADLAAARAREQRLRERTREFLLWLDFDAESVDTQERRKELDAALADQPAADKPQGFPGVADQNARPVSWTSDSPASAAADEPGERE